jgi:hypothetical protein
MPAVGPRIREQLVPLVERLRGVERGFRGRAEEPVRVALQLGQVVEERRRVALLGPVNEAISPCFAFDGSNHVPR